MNATDFIKQHGVDKAREVAATCHKIPNYTFKEKTEHGYSSCKSVDISDLKRLVESVDLIKFYNGIEKANFLLEMSNRPSLRPPHPSEVKLKQAIADYESIYSNDMGDDSHIENHVSPLCHHHWVDGLDGGTLVCAHKCGAWR